MFKDFAQRSYELERIDTGDYTPAEYEEFLHDIRLVNRFAGDNWALRKTLFKEIEREDESKFSVLDIGAGSGELLRTCADFARNNEQSTKLTGLELNERSAKSILEESINYPEISSVRGNALDLPFQDDSFDFVICSLFTHHFRETEILSILENMARVARRKIFVIDLHRHPVASLMYKAFCAVLIRGILVKTDGALSILRGFRPSELEDISKQARLVSARVHRHFPFRLVLEAEAKTE